MDTPIYNFVKNYSQANGIRLHMPGHKGKGFLNESLDITEIKGADSLFEADGIIAESEKNASQIFGTKKTLYSTQGSTLCIQTMISLATTDRHNTDKRPLIVATRNAHKAFLNSCILFDCDVKWVYSSEKSDSIANVKFSPDDIENAIKSCEYKPCCVYITSPDYLGNIADIKGIAKLCHSYNIPLLVDNAHGSYLRFLANDIHPVTLGADMCCDSAHKTLPALTSCAYLHISNNAPEEFSRQAKDAMAMLSSTSPSYLALTSLDLCNRYLSDNIKSELSLIIPAIKTLKKELTKYGYILCGKEPLKLTIHASVSGIYGNDIAEILRQKNIECEYSDKSHIVFMFSGKNTTQEIMLLKKELLGIKLSDRPIDLFSFSLENSIQKVSMRNAGLGKSEKLPVEECVGRICSKAVITCPPGIPVCVSGEEVTPLTVKILKNYGIKTLNVLK